MIPAKIEYDASTNVYTQMGLVRVVSGPTNTPKYVQPEEWVEDHFAKSDGSVERAYREAVAMGLVSNDAQGKLAWMDLKSQGSWTRGPGGELVTTRPRDQMLTVRYLIALMTERMYGYLPPVPGPLLAEGITSWDQVASG